MYDVRRASTTSAILKVLAKFKRIENGEEDIGQFCRNHSAFIAANTYDVYVFSIIEIYKKILNFFNTGSLWPVK